MLVDAQQFNKMGLVTKQACLESTTHLLWWLVCIVEWETEQRIRCDDRTAVVLTTHLSTGSQGRQSNPSSLKLHHMGPTRHLDGPGHVGLHHFVQKRSERVCNSHRCVWKPRNSFFEQCWCKFVCARFAFFKWLDVAV